MLRYLKNISLFGVGMLIVAIAFELVLRYGGVMNPILTIDPVKGERYMANQSCCSLFNYEGFGLSSTNEEGWFGPLFKDEGDEEKSFAVLGNSFIAGRQVFERHNFISRSNKAFEEAGDGARLYNFGKETMPLRESLYIKEEIDSMHQPDHFLIFINYRSLGNEGRYIPYYELSDGELQLNSEFRQHPFVQRYDQFKVLTSSSFVFMIYGVKKHLPNTAAILLDKLHPPIPPENEDPTGHTREMEDVDRAVLKKFASDPRVIFLVDGVEAMMREVRQEVGNAPIINIRPALNTLRLRGVDPYYWKINNKHGHWNYQAHEVITEVVTNAIRNQFLEN